MGGLFRWGGLEARPHHLFIFMWLALVPCAARAQLPSAADCIAAYNAADGWVRDWTVPHEAQPIDPAGTTGACVTLRLGGRVLGRGTAFGDSKDALWRAARDAYVQAVEALPIENDALREQRVREILPRVMLDIQFAGEMTPILAENEAAVALHVAPGVEGIAARVGDRLEGVFPGAMLGTDLTPGEALRVCLAKLNLPPSPLADLKRAADLTIYRFPVRHLAQPAEQAAPEFLYRGGRVIALSEVTGPRLRQAAAQIASHLLSHAWPGEEPHGMTGDYLPLTDKYQPLIAQPLEQAAAAFALARFAGTPGIAERDASRARRFAADVLEKLAVIAPGESDPLDDPLGASMWVVAMAATKEAGGVVNDESGFGVRALEVVQSTFTLNDGAVAWTDRAPAAGRSLLAFALASAARDDAALAVTRAVFRETDAGRLVSEMPWLAWAELALHPPPAPIPSETAVLELRRTIISFQLGEADLSPTSEDLLGGIAFSRAASPLPTWSTLRPAAFLAAAIADPRLTPRPEVVPEIARLRPTLRYLLQLILDDPALHMARDRDRALGGVRGAVWSQTASLEASSMALLTLSETLRAMHVRSPGTPRNPVDSATEGTKEP